jgi:hypothetical protein
VERAGRRSKQIYCPCPIRRHFLAAGLLVVGFNVAGGVDGALGRVFLVTSPALIDPNAFLQVLQSQPGIQHAELDVLLKVMQAAGPAPPSGLWDNAPVNYFGVTVIHGYVSQLATSIVRLPDTQAAFGVSGTGTVAVAVIDPGVDPTHPVLQSVLVAGSDFTRNIAGTGSELPDVNQSSTGSGASPAMVNQSSAAILDPQSVMNLHQPQFQAFGHGTKVLGIVHLVAPTAYIKCDFV